MKDVKHVNLKKNVQNVILDIIYMIINVIITVLMVHFKMMTIIPAPLVILLVKPAQIKIMMIAIPVKTNYYSGRTLV